MIHYDRDSETFDDSGSLISSVLTQEIVRALGRRLSNGGQPDLKLQRHTHGGKGGPWNRCVPPEAFT